MSQKLVSVIIPNYNSFEFIKETLDSVFNQTYKNIELIIVDDGSSDGSFEYIESLDTSYLQLIRNESKGACAARNFGLSLAKGDYIQFLDADDLLGHDKIEAQVKLLENFENRVAVCSTEHFYESQQKEIVSDKPFMFSTSQPKNFLLNLYGADGEHHDMVAQHAWLTPRAVIDKAGTWDESLIKDQDGEFFCRVAMASEGICYAKNVLCYYRKHDQIGSISSGKSEKHLDSQLQAQNSKFEQLNTDENSNAFKTAMALQYKIIGIDAYPENKAIYKDALTRVVQNGGSDYEPVLGGRFIEYIKATFGWKTAKSLSVFVHKHIKR